MKSKEMAQVEREKPCRNGWFARTSLWDNTIYGSPGRWRKENILSHANRILRNKGVTWSKALQMSWALAKMQRQGSISNFPFVAVVEPSLEKPRIICNGVEMEMEKSVFDNYIDPTDEKQGWTKWSYLHFFRAGDRVQIETYLSDGVTPYKYAAIVEKNGDWRLEVVEE
jgi:hypothetical protein